MRKTDFSQEEIKASGTKGMLLKSFGDRFFFRIYAYDGKGTFKDYEINHHDLKITITDEDACFYGNCIDYSKKTLGKK